MQNYIVYNPTTGEILRAGSAIPEIAELQAGPGEVVAMCDRLIDNTQYRVQDGVIVPIG